jgi:hypothetical protein
MLSFVLRSLYILCGIILNKLHLHDVSYRAVHVPCIYLFICEYVLYTHQRYIFQFLFLVERLATTCCPRASSLGRLQALPQLFCYKLTSRVITLLDNHVFSSLTGKSQAHMSKKFSQSGH